MPFDNDQDTQFLLEVYRLTQGDGSIQVATTEVGAALGLNKDAAGRLSEECIGNGWLEIKTLSGGIGITPDGVAAARAAGGQVPAADGRLTIGTGPIVLTDARMAVEFLINDIKQHLASVTTPYPQLEEMVMDLKTLEIQMCSPQPKTAIVREILRSLQDALVNCDGAQVAQNLAAAIE
jgi:hypothetical protein